MTPKAVPLPTDETLQERLSSIPRLLGLRESVLNGSLDALGGERGAADGVNTFNAVLLDDFRNHLFDRSSDDHFGFAVLHNLDVGDLAGLDVNLDGDDGFAALAFARVGAILVGGSLGADGEKGGSSGNDNLLHDMQYLSNEMRFWAAGRLCKGEKLPSTGA